MLYTTYLRQINNIPDTARKILIMQYKQKGLDKYDLEWIPELAPANFNAYKFEAKITKQEMFIEYKEQLERSPAKEKVDEIISSLEKGEDVFVICCEKDLSTCHRRILAQHIKDLTGFEWEEYKGGIAI